MEDGGRALDRFPHACGVTHVDRDSLDVQAVDARVVRSGGEHGDDVDASRKQHTRDGGPDEPGRTGDDDADPCLDRTPPRLVVLCPVHDAQTRSLCSAPLARVFPNSKSSDELR
jgi:hypothetical protein